MNENALMLGIACFPISLIGIFLGIHIIGLGFQWLGIGFILYGIFRKPKRRSK